MIVLIRTSQTGIAYCLIKDRKRTVGKIAFDLDLLKEVIQKAAHGSEIGIFGYRVLNGSSRITSPVMEAAPSLTAHLGEAFQIDTETDALMRDVIGFCRRHFVVSRHFLLCESALACELPEYVRRFAIPEQETDPAIRRTGREGLAHQWALSLGREKGLLSGDRVVTVSLGDASSIMAFSKGRPEWMSDGFSEIGGVMSSRSAGLIDTALIFQLISSGQTCEEIRGILSGQSGFSALAGEGCSLEELFSRSDERARFAQDVFRYQLIKYFGTCAAVLGGIDTIIFFGDYGKGTARLIHDLLQSLSFLGLVSSSPATCDGVAALTSTDSQVQAYHLLYDPWAVMEALLSQDPFLKTEPSMAQESR